VSASSYSAGVIVVRGTPGSFEAVTCGPGSVNFSSDPAGGVTYYVLAFDDTASPPNGGTLQINVREVPSPAGAVTVNATGEVKPKTGAITVSGTFTCTNSDFAFIDLLVTQNIGRATISGSAEPDLAPCDGQPHSWSADVLGTDRRFVGVNANVDAYMLACNAFTCASDEAIQTIRLRGR